MAQHVVYAQPGSILPYSSLPKLCKNNKQINLNGMIVAIVVVYLRIWATPPFVDGLITGVRPCANDMAAVFWKLCAIFTVLGRLAPVGGELVLPSWDGYSAQDDYDVLKFQPDRPPGFSNYSQTGIVNSTGRSYTVHVAVLSKGLPSTFGFELPQGGKLCTCQRVFLYKQIDQLTS